MSAPGWKQGKTCKVGRRWGWVSYLLPTGEAIVTLEDGGQETVPVGDLEDPTISVGVQKMADGQRPTPGRVSMTIKEKFPLRCPR